MTAYENLVALSDRRDEDMLYLTGSDMGAIIEIENIVCLAACSLDMHPGKSNWVQDNGGLPNAICEMAKDIVEKGKSVSHAIAIAVSQAKKLAATSKDPKVRAKYTAAVAQWEALKARARAKGALK